ncbi:hypothetical protein SVIO_086240 [Streptomyces violaceusniger]|uniref:Uncharacterized protein n=1 Tax=Streptomyces violaceusniger TaxID=68280 RepID=A0A4D4L8U4_STRVO|nr:hypothetical protein SVIO_086240 [Streptomyces violaceusniger]
MAAPTHHLDRALGREVTVPAEVDVGGAADRGQAEPDPGHPRPGGRDLRETFDTHGSVPASPIPSLADRLSLAVSPRQRLAPAHAY